MDQELAKLVHTGILQDDRNIQLTPWVEPFIAITLHIHKELQTAAGFIDSAGWCLSCPHAGDTAPALVGVGAASAALSVLVPLHISLLGVSAQPWAVIAGVKTTLLDFIPCFPGPSMIQRKQLLSRFMALVAAVVVFGSLSWSTKEKYV